MGEEKEENETNTKKQSSDSNTGPFIISEETSHFIQHDPVEVTSAGVFNPSLPIYSAPQNFLSDSDELLGGTISTLGNLRKSIQTVENNMFSMIEPNIDKKLAQDLMPIRKDLESTKEAVEEASKTLITLRGFVKSNEQSFINIIAVEGKLRVMESQMSSVQHRVEKLETDKNINWNKTTTILALVVSVISMCCGAGAVIIAVLPYLK